MEKTLPNKYSSPSKIVIGINLAAAMLILISSFRRYENYLYLSRLLNGPSIEFSIRDYLETSRSLLVLVALCVLGAVMEVRQYRYSWILNFLIPTAFLTRLIFQFVRHRGLEPEAQAAFLLLAIPLLLICSLYGVIYLQRYKRTKFLPGEIQ